MSSKPKSSLSPGTGCSAAQNWQQLRTARLSHWVASSRGRSARYVMSPHGTFRTCRGADLIPLKRSNIVPWRMACMGRTSRSRRPWARGEVLCAGGLIHARTRVPGRLGRATSRTPSMYVDEKSVEAIVLAKRLNKGRQLPAEVAEGRASPKGNSR
jgi:hypothetical protein